MTEIDWTKPIRHKLNKKMALCVSGHFLKISYVGGGDDYVLESDLENVPEPRFRWSNIYSGQQTTLELHESRLEADTSSANSRLYVLKLNLDTGEAVKEPVGIYPL